MDTGLDSTALESLPMGLSEPEKVDVEDDKEALFMAYVLFLELCIHLV